MILTEIQAYIGRKERVSLTELANHFHTDTDAIRPMLQRLIRKGRVRQMEIKSAIR